MGAMNAISGGGVGAMGAGMSNSHAGSTENAYGGVDIMERISYIVDDAQQAGPHDMKSTPPVYRSPDKMEGQYGGGPCCNICPLWFIPQNQKLHLQGDIQPEFGRAVGVLIEKGEKKQGQKNAHKKGFMGTVPVPRIGAKSRGGIGRGPSQCCNVCTDEAFPMRDINSVNDMTFLEIKNQLKLKINEKANEKATTKTTRKRMRKIPIAPASNVEQCCYLCTEQANGGWEGTDPFSEPTSWGQHLEDQSKDPSFMREIADMRTYQHERTTSPYYKAQAAVIEQLGSRL